MFIRRSFHPKRAAAMRRNVNSISAFSRRWMNNSRRCSTASATTTELRDNTLILVCSDNGPEDGAGSAGPFRGLKGMLYEGGIRSPLVVWGPGFVAKNKIGTTNASSFLAAIDLAPSLLEIAGVSKPAGVEFDGQALSDVLLGRSERSRTKPLFFRRPPDRPRHNGEGNLPDLAVRDGRLEIAVRIRRLGTAALQTRYGPGRNVKCCGGQSKNC